MLDRLITITRITIYSMFLFFVIILLERCAIVILKSTPEEFLAYKWLEIIIDSMKLGSLLGLIGGFASLLFWHSDGYKKQ